MSGMPQSLREPLQKVQSIALELRTAANFEDRKKVVSGLTDAQRRDLSKYESELLDELKGVEKRRSEIKEDLRRLQMLRTE